MRPSLPSDQPSIVEVDDGRSPLRILIVDDDPVQQALMQRVAKLSGYETISATSCREALHYIHSKTFDCMVLDLNLGDGDGIDICKAMEQSGYTGVIIIVSGADASRRTAARAIARSAGIETRGLPKPVDLSSLRICLANLGKDSQGLPVIHAWGGLAVDQTMDEHRIQ